MVALVCSFLPTSPSLIIHSQTRTFLTIKSPLIVTSSASSEAELVSPISTKQQWLSKLFKSFDHLICTFIDHSPLHPTVDPRHVLSGNFAPVDELPPTACDVVEGSLPSCLDGAYLRNGPNPQFTPRGPYHLFDGDGMLHVLKISRGEATFCSRYVRTYKYTVEREIGYPVFPSPFSTFSNGLAASMARSVLLMARVLTGQLRLATKGFGQANTSVALIGGRLFALGESDLPYAIKVTPDGDVITLGRHNFFADEPFLNMTAHPKIDPETGEAIAIRYHVIHPFLTLFRIDPNGKKQADVTISAINNKNGATFVHDFGVTKHYAILPDTQIVIDPMEITRGRPLVRVDMAKMPRLGIIRRDAKDDTEMWWIDAPGFNMIHCYNAWEEDDGDTIVIVASNATSVEFFLERLDLAQLTMQKIRIDVKAKTFEADPPISNKVLEFGGINPAYAGKKSRYVYVSMLSQPMGVVKVDVLRNCIVASREYGASFNANEPFFVAREPDNPTAEEDDGYLITYAHCEDTRESKFLVMDAKSPALEIVAEVKLPGRVPTGLHGLFVTESDLNKL